jgi:hypothetical protein
MATAVKVRTRVLPGHRVEFSAPELVEGGEVEVIALQDEPARQEPVVSMIELRKTFPQRRLTDEEWEQRDREFQEERDSWDH